MTVLYNPSKELAAPIWKNEDRSHKSKNIIRKTGLFVMV
jgi:hypothetical protein